MKEYRIFLLDGAGRIVSSLELVCDSDSDAQESAKQVLRPGQQAEIWQLGRRVNIITGDSIDVI